MPRRDVYPESAPHTDWNSRWGFSTQEFAAAGLRTFAIVEGRADAFPALFVHGLPGGAFLWAPVIAELGRACRCIAPDFPGWGGSRSRQTVIQYDYSPAALRAWLNGVLAAQQIDRFDLIAHGSGAWPALELFASDPSRVRRLALVNPRLGLDADSNSKSAIFRRRQIDWPARRIKRWLGGQAALTADASSAWRHVFLQMVGDAKLCPGLDDAAYAPQWLHVRAALARYSGAVLLLWGKRDPQADPAQQTGFAAMLQSPDVHVLEGAGHYPMLDAPAETACLFREFLVY